MSEQSASLTASTRSSSKRKFYPRSSQACDMCRLKKSKPWFSRFETDGVPLLTGIGIQVQPRATMPDLSSARHPRSASRARLEENSFENRLCVEKSPVPRLPDASKTPLQSETRDSFPGNNSPPASTVNIASNPPFQASALGGLQTVTENSALSFLDNETIGAVNEHTSGTEFYGRSSNLVLLNQLLSKARTRTYTTDASSPIQRQASFADSTGVEQFSQQGRSPSDQTAVEYTNQNDTLASRDSPRNADQTHPMSVVSILYNENSAWPDSGPITPVVVAGRAKKQLATVVEVQRTGTKKSSRDTLTESLSARLKSNAKEAFERPGNPNNFVASDPRTSDSMSNSSVCFFGTPMLLEMEYINLYFQNLFYLQPFLTYGTFKTRCEREIWTSTPLRRVRRDQMHFMALYNAVLAVGALTAGTEILRGYREELDADKDTVDARQKPVVSSMRLSELYFHRARRLLGDIFEVCSLESSQTLLLMSLYCQYALKPHACYMYSGMAVRNALAIGLPDDSGSQPSESRLESRKTWWAIYSQEIEICCSSGRLSSLMGPDKYSVLLPKSKSENMPEPDEAQVSIIPEVARLSAILLRASKRLYHSHKDNLPLEKWQAALELNEALDLWKLSLPSWLNPDTTAFREPEGESKQKLSLQLRYYSAKIFIHRPFVATSTTMASSKSARNIEACLDAARKTIGLLYEAYAHRHYFRTWWYNSSYTLHASVIILYVILLDCTDIPSSELVGDVQRGLKILRAMEEIDVARRSANLVQEILEVAESYIRSKSQQDHQLQPTSLGNGIHPQEPSIFPLRDHRMLNFINPSTNIYDESLTGIIEDGYSSQSRIEFARDDMLASLMNPGGLEGFETALDNSMMIDLGETMADIGWGTAYQTDNAMYPGQWSWFNENQSHQA